LLQLNHGVDQVKIVLYVENLADSRDKELRFFTLAAKLKQRLFGQLFAVRGLFGDADLLCRGLFFCGQFLGRSLLYGGLLYRGLFYRGGFGRGCFFSGSLFGRGFLGGGVLGGCRGLPAGRGFRFVSQPQERAYLECTAGGLALHYGRRVKDAELDQVGDGREIERAARDAVLDGRGPVHFELADSCRRYPLFLVRGYEVAGRYAILTRPFVERTQG